MAFAIAALACQAATAAIAETPEEFSARYLAAVKADGLKAIPNFLDDTESRKLGDLVVELAGIAAQAGKPLPFLGAGETAESLKSLPSKESGARFFSWLDTAAPQLTQVMKTANARPLGHVTDGDFVYVVAKLTFKVEGEEIVSTDVLPLKKSGDGYRMLLKAEMTGVLKSMKKQLEATKPR